MGGNYLLLCSDCGSSTMDVRLWLFESGGSTLGGLLRLLSGS